MKNKGKVGKRGGGEEKALEKGVKNLRMRGFERKSGLKGGREVGKKELGEGTREGGNKKEGRKGRVGSTWREERKDGEKHGMRRRGGRTVEGREGGKEGGRKERREGRVQGKVKKKR